MLTDIDRLETENERDLFSIGATRATQRVAVLAHVQTHGDFPSDPSRVLYDG